MARAVVRLGMGATWRTLRPGQVICREGEPADLALIVVSGALLLSVSGPSGRSLVIEILGPDELLASCLSREIALADPAPLTPEVRALLASRLLAVPGAALDLAVRRRPEIASWVALATNARVGSLERRLASSLGSTVADRVEELLHGLAQVHGHPMGNEVRIGLPLTQELIAAMTGSTRESVNRALRAMSDSGRLRRARGWYVLSQRPGRQGSREQMG